MKCNNEVQIERFSRPRPEPQCSELRCLCGSLLARLVAGGVELKCRRCKRTIVIPLSAS